MRNEKTSKRVRAIAGRVLRALKDADDWPLRRFASVGFMEIDGKRKELWIVEGTYKGLTLADLKALAASCLTQAPPKAKARGWKK